MLEEASPDFYISLKSGDFCTCLGDQNSVKCHSFYHTVHDNVYFACIIILCHQNSHMLEISVQFNQLDGPLKQAKKTKDCD